MKVIIISQPKSGTYLCANLLQNFNIGFEGYHLAEERYQKYDLNDLQRARTPGATQSIYKPAIESVGLIKEYHFAVSHLHYNTDLANVLEDYKKIILTRDFKERLESWNRWCDYRNANKNSPHVNEELQDGKLKWLEHNNSFELTFDEMINCNKEALDNLQQFLFNEVKFDSIKEMQLAKEQDSLTKLGR